MEGDAQNLIALFSPFKNKTKNTGVENQSSPEQQKKKSILKNRVLL